MKKKLNENIIEDSFPLEACITVREKDETYKQTTHFQRVVSTTVKEVNVMKSKYARSGHGQDRMGNFRHDS